MNRIHRLGMLALPVIAGIGCAPFSRAQSRVDPPADAFDVASVRPAAIRPGREGGKQSEIQYTPDSLTMWNVDLTDCLQWAYDLRSYQISEGASVNAERYDIRAKTGEPAPVSRIRAMLQELLAARFQLAAHRSTKTLPVYELVIAKGGPKLPGPKAGVDRSAAHASESLPRVQNGSFVFEDTSMAEFAAKLSLLRGIDLPVVDRTGIEGVFDITWKFAADAIRQPDGPSLFTLLQEQLGLKLVAAKAPLEVLVVDHVTKPAVN